MNNIRAKAKVRDTYIALDYEYEGKIYTIEVPRTPRNETMRDGEIVQVLLGVMPVTDETVFNDPTLEMYQV